MEMYKLVPSLVREFDFTVLQSWKVFRGWLQQPRGVLVQVHARTSEET